MAFDPLKLLTGKPPTRDKSRDAGRDPARDDVAPPAGAPLAGDRREMVQRLQVGFFGLGAMILLVGLANLIMKGVQESQASAVPETPPTVAASESPAASRDPLADAGVVPDLPAEPEPTETPTEAAPPLDAPSDAPPPTPQP